MDILNRIGDVFNRFSNWEFVVSAVIFVCLLTIVYYYLFAFLKSNTSSNLITVFVVLMVSGAVFFLFTSQSIFPSNDFIFVPIMFLIFIILVYSNEIKRAFISGQLKLHEIKSLDENIDEREIETCIEEIIKSLQNMSKGNIGALIILSNSNIPTQVLDSGVRINADISSALIESIFFPKTALHDGALIIQRNKIQAAGCFLPLSQVVNIPKDLGTRHRAGIGITETSDVISIIVSEETGIISIVKAGKLTRYADSTILKNTLKDYYWQDFVTSKQRRF